MSTTIGESTVVRFAKGHGTGNDFVLVPDVEASREWDSAMVRRICDRRFGVGGDGLLRIVPTKAVDGWQDAADRAEWFMDYRNGDGSLAEMCGNGARVFGRYLVRSGLQSPGEFSIATRSGVLRVRADATGPVYAEMGVARELSESTPVRLGDATWQAIAVALPNPHAVVEVNDLDEAGPLVQAPRVSSDVFPNGANVEFVRSMGPQELSMRVHERGVGETLSCGTGACAAAWAHVRRHGGSLAEGVRVHVPGGRLVVQQDNQGHIVLGGPAQIVAEGTLAPEWWSGP